MRNAVTKTGKLTKKAQARLVEARISRVYAECCAGVQIPIMAILDVFKVAEAAIDKGVDDAELARRIVAYVSIIRVN